MNRFLKASVFILAFSIFSVPLFSQSNQNQNSLPPQGWHLLDRETHGFYGISLDKAYEFIKSKNLKGKEVIVAVIDSGIDTLHEDLKPVLWRNPGEIPGNGIDDDNNGYVDDVYGWNFLGGKDGRNVKEDSYEGARVYHKLKEKYGNVSVDIASLSNEEKEEYLTWLRAKEKIEGSDAGEDLVMMKRIYESVMKSDSILRIALNKEVYTGVELDTFTTKTREERTAKSMILYLLRANEQMDNTNKDFIEGFGDYVKGQIRKAEAAHNPPPNYRGDIVKDNYYDFNDKYYGNPDVMASTPFHGTHVAGIIGAARNNNLGIDGIADNVKIMAIRAVPDGDEHDKDVALAIIYAVDNGAKVINMSFGKEFSPEKHWVDDAVRYAEKKGVLIVHAAGNDAKNLDSSYNFPNPVFKDNGQLAKNFITVGASGDPRNGGLTASFSNYGKTVVDVFAPGVGIYSTIPGGNTYGSAQGTSMASPVVAGTAALIFSYFPYLTPEQVKYAITSSAYVPDEEVRIPGTDNKARLSDISISGGILNAYEAIKVASTLKPDGSIPSASPNSTLKNKAN